MSDDQIWLLLAFTSEPIGGFVPAKSRTCQWRRCWTREDAVAWTHKLRERGIGYKCRKVARPGRRVTMPEVRAAIAAKAARIEREAGKYEAEAAQQEAQRHNRNAIDRANRVVEALVANQFGG